MESTNERIEQVDLIVRGNGGVETEWSTAEGVAHSRVVEERVAGRAEECE
jgi:hypothetical protein